MPNESAAAQATDERSPVAAVLSWTIGGVAVTFAAVWFLMRAMGHEPLGPARASATTVLATVLVLVPAQVAIGRQQKLRIPTLLLASIGGAAIAFALARLASTALGVAEISAAGTAASSTFMLLFLHGLVVRRASHRH